MAEKKSFQLGRNLTVTVPEAVADQVSAAFAETFGRHGPRRTTAQSRAASAAKLSSERIVDVAIEQMRENGYDAVTMRSIARALGTGPASLYAHVANKAELDQLVIGRVSSAWQVPDPDPKHWEDQVRQAMRDLLGIYRAHPGVARCSMGMIPTSVETLLPTERMLALLRAGGVPDQYAAWYIDLMALFLGAVAMEEDIWLERNRDNARADKPHTEDEVVAQVHDIFASLPPEHFPMMSAMAGVLTTGSAEDRFEFALDVLLGGLKALAKK